MPEEGEQIPEVHTESESSTAKWVLLLLAVIYVAGSLYLLFDLRGRLDKLSHDENASKAQSADLMKRVQSAEANDETLAQQVGLTKKQLVQRAAELQRQQRAAEARLAEEQKQQISAVTGEVAGGKDHGGGVNSRGACPNCALEG